MTNLIIIAIDSRYSIICQYENLKNFNMWDNIVGYVQAERNKRKFDIELNGEKLGRVNWFKDAMPILESKLGIKCQFMFDDNYRQYK
jgi:hypothetical protein